MQCRLLHQCALSRFSRNHRFRNPKPVKKKTCQEETLSEGKCVLHSVLCTLVVNSLLQLHLNIYANKTYVHTFEIH